MSARKSSSPTPRRLARWSGSLLLATSLALAAAGAVDVSPLRTFDPQAYDGALEPAVAAALRAADAAERAAIEHHLAAIAADAAASLPGRQLACRLLHSCATEASVVALAPLLLDDEMAFPARFALEGVGGSAADLALLLALGRSDGDIRRGIIASLAARHTSAAVEPLLQLALRSDDATALAAVHALGGLVREPREVNALAALPFADSAALLEAQQEAFFSAIVRLHETGINLDEVVIPFPKMQARSTAIGDLAVGVFLRMSPERAVQEILALFEIDDPIYQRRAATALGLLIEPEARARLVAHASELAPDARALVIGGLAARDARDVLPLARAALTDDTHQLRLAAIDALGRLGDASDVPALLDLAPSDDEIATVARAALARIPDSKADALLLAEFQRADSPLRARLPDIFVERGQRAAVGELLRAAPAASPEIAGECYRAIGALGLADAVTDLWEQWTHAAPPARPPIERAIVAIGRRVTDDSVTMQLTKHWTDKDPAVRPAVVEMLGGIGDRTALVFLVPLIETRPPDAEALRTLLAWRSPEALPDFQKLVGARKPADSLRQSLWPTLVRLAEQHVRGNRREGLKSMEACLQLARTPDERHAVIAAVARHPHRLNLALLARWADDPQIATEAAAARDAMQKQLAE